MDDFKASNGWVGRWKVWNNVTFKTVPCKLKSSTPEIDSTLKGNEPTNNTIKVQIAGYL